VAPGKRVCVAERSAQIAMSAVVRCGALRGSRRITRVVDQGIEGVLLAQVREEVLLAPALEHPAGDLDRPLR
jgi:hypothetical protein